MLRFPFAIAIIALYGCQTDAPPASTNRDPAEGVTFFGSSGEDSLRVAYVIDASGSMIDTMPFVVRELNESIQSLSDRHQYTVIFITQQEPAEQPPAGWKQATRENRENSQRFLDLSEGHIVPRGHTDPEASIRLAVSYQPNLMFILSDNILSRRAAWEPGSEWIHELLGEVNPERKIKISTFQFLYTDPLDTMKRIAAEHGGTYRFISSKDLGFD